MTIALAATYLAAGAANPSCRKCHGRGTRGRLTRPGGGATILICPCAAPAFPDSILKRDHIRLPYEAYRNVKEAL